MPSSEYLLGVNQAELERLRFQHSVWGPVTRKLFDRVQLQQGWRCLDAGAGPGFAAMDLLGLVGDQGEVAVLEPSEFYLDWFKRSCSDRQLKNIKIIQGTAENTPFPQRYYDFIFIRWVINFVADIEAFLTPLVSSLKMGGILAIQDYYYEGLSLYPRGGAWDTMPDIVRAYYRSGGGDPYATAKLPELFVKYNLQLVDFTPNCLIGGPLSPVTHWAGQFFTHHTPLMAERGIITQEESISLMADWEDHRENPETIFFSPIVMDVAGKLI
ncbi:MAG: methyltransferase domain-containing protein [bacterium]